MKRFLITVILVCVLVPSVLFAGMGPIKNDPSDIERVRSGQEPSAGGEAQEGQAPFYVNPLSQSIRLVRDRITQMRSPVSNPEAATQPGQVPQVSAPKEAPAQ